MNKFTSTRIAATCSKKAGNSLTDPRRKKLSLGRSIAMYLWHVTCLSMSVRTHDGFSPLSRHFWNLEEISFLFINIFNFNVFVNVKVNLLLP
jgi:hypothetical protein